MKRTNEELIAVVGATGQQGGAVVRALQAGGQFKVRALSRNPGKHRELADEVVRADLNRPETLQAAFEGALGIFLVTNLWEEGTDEIGPATAAVRAAKDAGVRHFISHSVVGAGERVLRFVRGNARRAECFKGLLDPNGPRFFF
jgi:uncharacterized protein YbjT (DUF2867 family)